MRRPALFLPALCVTVAGAQTTYEVRALDPEIAERWAVPATFAIRRSAVGAAETVAIAFSGLARRGTDYVASHTTSVSFPANANETWVTITPRRDRVPERPETIVLSLPGRSASATMTIEDDRGLPSETETVRFLLQAGFGADAETIAEVRSMGFRPWIAAQMTRPLTSQRAVLDRRLAAGQQDWEAGTSVAFWEVAMKRRYRNPDLLRQRIASAYEQIFVISVAVGDAPGCASYHDGLATHAFGNYRDLLRFVATSPMMGQYLSHLKNRKGDPTIPRYPDENFAREILQLFSIGLWELNGDGTRKLNLGQPIPTYDSATISAYARVFTGWSYGGPGGTQFEWPEWNFEAPMRPWDEYHDLAPKTLLSGIVTPARVSGGPESGTATRADLEAAIESLHRHPNTGPFLALRLIQRMVTSNPSPGYVGRVAAAFANDGTGVRGNMGAVVRAILLDPEARDPEWTAGKNWGRKREPYLTILHLAKSFNAWPEHGEWEQVRWWYDEFRQEPFRSPSVFNFYSPFYRPPGDATRSDVKAPEFQIMTAATAHGALNMAFQTIHYDVSRWGGDAGTRILIAPTEFVAVAHDPDLLVFRVARRILDRPLRPRAFRIIRDAVAKLPNVTVEDRRNRFNMAAHLIVTTPEFQIQK